jgi:pimeloyl-ACP methyl ester carboxylesterase
MPSRTAFAGLATISALALTATAVDGATTSQSTVAEGSVEATPDTVAETSIVAATDTVAETSVATSETAEVEILPPDESYGGATLGEWHARWWQWAASLPTGFECNYGQHGPMFFLPPAFESEYDCVVPEGTAIYAIVDGQQCSSALTPPLFGGNEEELNACLNGLPGAVSPSLDAAANGQEVARLYDYWTRSPMFTLNVPEHSVYNGVPSGVASWMVAQAAYIIAPPPPGEYVITLTDESYDFEYTVNVTVESPRVFEPFGTETTGAEDTIDGLFDVGGGRNLYLHCEGSGSPTVVYLHGHGGPSSNAGGIPSLLRDDYRVCVYDRANVGRSDPAPGPLTPADAVEDLHTLLDVAEVPGPYVLLGASFGGDIAFFYAATHPDDLVGLVFLDPDVPDPTGVMQEFVPEGFPAPEDELRDFWRDDPEQMDDAFLWFDQLNATAESFPAVPAILLTPPESEFPPEFGEGVAETFRQVQEDTMALFDPGEVRIVDSQHYMEQAIPDEVAAAVRDVIDASSSAEAPATSAPTTSG